MPATPPPDPIAALTGTARLVGVILAAGTAALAVAAVVFAALAIWGGRR